MRDDLEEGMGAAFYAVVISLAAVLAALAWILR